MDFRLITQLHETDLFATKSEAKPAAEVVYQVGNAEGSVILLLTQDGVNKLRQAYTENPEPEDGVIFVEGLPIPIDLFLKNN